MEEEEAEIGRGVGGVRRGGGRGGEGCEWEDCGRDGDGRGILSKEERERENSGGGRERESGGGHCERECRRSERSK